MKKNILTLALVLFSAAAFAETHTYTYDFTQVSLWSTVSGGTTNPTTGTGSSHTAIGTIYCIANNHAFTGSTSADVYFQSGYLMLNSGSTLTLPTYSGQKITTVVLSNKQSSTSAKVSVLQGTNTASAEQTWSTTNTDYTYAIGEDYQQLQLTVSASSKNAQVKTITVTTEDAATTPTVDPTEPTGPTAAISEWMASATNNASTSLTLTNAIVMGYKAGTSTANIYLYDGERAMIVYGSSLPTDITYGKTFSGTISGTYTTYSGLPEIKSATITTGYTLGTATHPLQGTPISTTEASTYQGKLVRLSAVSFGASSLSSKSVTLTDADGSIALYDTYGVFSSTQFDAATPAYVTGIIGVYNSTYQIYVSGTDYISYEQPKQTPTASWKFVVPADYAGVYPSFITNSDGQKHYSSTAAAVATVAADGTVSLVAEGETTVSCFADATAFFKAASEKSYLLKIVAAAVQTVTGDVNMDGSVDVSDISTLAEYIFGNTPAQFNRTAADANNDGTIDVSDISTIAEIIFQQ